MIGHVPEEGSADPGRPASHTHPHTFSRVCLLSRAHGGHGTSINPREANAGQTVFWREKQRHSRPGLQPHHYTRYAGYLPYCRMHVHINASQVPPLSIRHTGGSTDLLRYRIRGVNMKRGSATECQKGFLRRVCSSHMLIRSGTLGEILGSPGHR